MTKRWAKREGDPAAWRAWTERTGWAWWQPRKASWSAVDGSYLL